MLEPNQLDMMKVVKVVGMILVCLGALSASSCCKKAAPTPPPYTEPAK